MQFLASIMMALAAAPTLEGGDVRHLLLGLPGEGVSPMFSLLRSLFVLALCLVGVGIYRGWFSMGSTTRDPQTNKVNISISVDADKVKADTARVKAKIKEEVAERVRQFDEAASKPTLK
jgi:hypothetical protein